MVSSMKSDKNIVRNPEDYKKCSICCKSTRTKDDTVCFGDWMETSKLQVHYFCLLLSTHLPQNGLDSSGILGFCTSDIRKEIKEAATRMCCYCGQMNASIACNKCKEYFHLVCGYRENCLFQFSGEFLSYCDKCLPINQLQKKWMINPPEARCHICHDLIGSYHPTKVIYGACCSLGFVHSYCMQKYALNAGYYLRCLWCRSIKFRDLVRLQGIFVPDRDAIWERQRDAFNDFHRAHRHCDTDNCLCPRGRDYSSTKWTLANCVLCGSYGAHNPICITKDVSSREPIADFKCEICSAIETDIAHEKTLSELLDTPTDVDTSMYMHKSQSAKTQIQKTPSSSDDENSASNSIITIISSQKERDIPRINNSNNSVVTQASAQEKISSVQNTSVSTSTDNENINNTVQRKSVAIDENCDQGNNTTVGNKFRSPRKVDQLPKRLLSTECDSEPEDENTDDWQEFEIFDIGETEQKVLQCKGTLTIRINLSGERFKNKTIDEILDKNLIEDKDIIGRSEDIGIFREIDAIIAEYANN